MGKGGLFHVEVKPVDPGSGTLHPSWGDSGLHYGYNSTLAGDGTYEATVTVGVLPSDAPRKTRTCGQSRLPPNSTSSSRAENSWR